MAGNAKHSFFRERELNALPNMRFVRWDTRPYRGVETCATMHCELCEHEWSATVKTLLYCRSFRAKCPKCTKRPRSGFDKTKPATLYLLRDRACGEICKIGVTRDYAQRERNLIVETPFKFDCVAQVYGSGEMIKQLEDMFLRILQPVKSRRWFPGHTEWRYWDDRLPEMFRTLQTYDLGRN